jgi:hypothetical protein
MHGAVKIRTSVPRCRRSLKMDTKTPRGPVGGFCPAEGAHIKIQPRQNRTLDVERMLTVIGGKKNRARGRDGSKVGRRQQAFTACCLKRTPLEQAHVRIPSKRTGLDAYMTRAKMAT